MLDYRQQTGEFDNSFDLVWIMNYFHLQSVQFHENGRRHKLNVAKRLSEIGKQSDVQMKVDQKMNEDMRRMNDAAMKAYMQDISGGGDFTSRAISQAMAAAGENEQPDMQPLASTSSYHSKQVDPMALTDYKSDDENGPRVLKKAAIEAAAANEVKDPSLWCEALTEDGDTYFWNVKTNESIWEKPKEGYMTIKEYEKLNELAVKQQEDRKHQDSKFSIQNADEHAAKLKREKFKKVIETKPQDVEEASVATDYEGQFGGQPYGKWQEVVHKPQKQINWELPKQVPLYIAVTNQEPEPPVKKFKEKTITSLDIAPNSAPGFFKKRKVAGSRNARQRTED